MMRDKKAVRRPWQTINLLHDHIDYHDQCDQEANSENHTGYDEVHWFASTEVTNLVFLGLHSETSGKYTTHYLQEGQVLLFLIRGAFPRFLLYDLIHKLLLNGLGITL